MNSMQHFRRLSLFCLLAVSACECPGSGNGGNGDGGNGDGSMNEDGATDGSTTTDGTVNGDASDSGNVCERIVLAPEVRYPEVLIVQDISGSMAGDRWDNTKAALADVGAELDDRLRLGLYYFPRVNAPNHNTCTLTTFPPNTYVDVAPAIGTGSAITTSLNMIAPKGGTPTAEALDQVVYPYLTMNRSGAPAGTMKYVILVTDGSPNCTQPGGDGDDPDHAVSQAATLTEVEQLYSAGIVTYVVGYEIGANLQDEMDDWAVAGHGRSTYIDVDDEDSLTNALTDIADEIVSCDYELNMAPTNTSYVSVKIDDVPVPLDPTNGWSLVGTKMVRLNGTACLTLRDGDQHEIDVAVECSPVIID